MQLHAYQMPVTATASWSRGAGGIVAPITAGSDDAAARNRNDVSHGIDGETPGRCASTSSTRRPAWTS